MFHTYGMGVTDHMLRIKTKCCTQKQNDTLPSNHIHKACIYCKYAVNCDLKKVSTIKVLYGIITAQSVTTYHVRYRVMHEKRRYSIFRDNQEQK